MKKLILAASLLLFLTGCWAGPCTYYPQLPVCPLSGPPLHPPGGSPQ